ncbi:hypothetical protein [Nocardia otitidiscaviarum]|uniref:hypothetical protein n=1 Tax=Nocardia otitidiscaviarum TaxID=1823 RepID=UPI001892DEEB|nr:hypothetical protein [Nocardia otitidiscaviarum]MBF6181379.1 hypothetical protein [Nocardia otitidiscaviarum]
MRIRVISLGFVAAAGGAAAVLVGSGTASAVAAEAAAHPGGGAYVSVVNPLDPRDPGALLVVGQYW